jgi:hydrogenase maturation protease
MQARVLVIGYGNPGRQDDGLGPRLAGEVERAAIPGVVAITDYQLNVEHAGDIADADTVIFADAAISGRTPCFFRRLTPRRAEGYSTHSMRPEAILAFAADTFGWSGRAYLLGVRGRAFNDFGEELSDDARENLAAATGLLLDALRAGRLDEATTDEPTDNSITHCYGAQTCKTAST